MYQDSLNKVKELTSSLAAVEKNLTEVRDARDELQRQLVNARARLKRKEQAKGLDKYTETLLKNIMKQAPETLLFEIDTAIGENPEFDNEGYKRALYTVTQDEDIYKPLLYGSHPLKRLDVQIVFEEKAGTLSDWAHGVTGYREHVLGTKEGDEEDGFGARATEFWVSKVYPNKGLNERTIVGRLAYSGRKAPFWQLLNSGTTSLASDREDGSYNPLEPSVPTDFIGEAERTLERFFTADYAVEAAEWYEDTIKFRQEKDEVESAVEEARTLVHQFSTDIRLNKTLFDRLGKLKKYVDEEKLAVAARKYRAGEEFEGKTLNLSKTGKGKLSRISTRKLEGLLDY